MVDELSKARVLVVEDDPAIRDLLRLVFNEWEATLVDCGSEAVAAWRRDDFALIIMDLQLPGMDGFETTKQIRREEEKAGRQHVTIIAVTGHVSQRDREEAVQAGMDDFISKPFKARDLLAIAKKHIPAE
jgi:hypothetical protein